MIQICEAAILFSNSANDELKVSNHIIQGTFILPILVWSLGGM
jgi:hypothetical protein